MDNSLRMGMHGVVGVSIPMQRIYRAMHASAIYHYPVLLTGESGSGKTLVAHSIHSMSRRDRESLLTVGCANRSYAQVKCGLFPGDRHHWSWKELASCGTVLLRDVSELALEQQFELLEVLRSKHVRIGLSRDVPFSARIISITRQDLTALVKNGTFLEELYVILNTVRIDVPPLRDRKIDISLLVDVFTDIFTKREPDIAFDGPAMNYLLAYDWPGNVRELKNTIERVVSCASDPVSCDLRRLLFRGSVCQGSVRVPQSDLERQVLMESLHRTQGNRSAAADILGITKSILERRMHRLRIAVAG
jgi:DNA-binding NtrC family response regulator